MSSEVNRGDAMSGAASGSGPSDEERAVDVLALPTPDPLSIDFSFPSFSWILASRKLLYSLCF